MLSAPIELMTRSLEPAQVAKLLAGQLAWAVATLAIGLFVWRRGIHRFEAVGA